VAGCGKPFRLRTSDSGETKAESLSDSASRRVGAGD
jgi:hypothetical protein